MLLRLRALGTRTFYTRCAVLHPPQDPWRLLGVSRTASRTEIRQAYLKQVPLVHPDRNKAADAKAKFQRLQEAYKQAMQSAEDAAPSQACHKAASQAASASASQTASRVYRRTRLANRAVLIFVVTQGAATLHSIMAQTGCGLRVDEKHLMLEYEGPPAACEAAAERVRAFLAECRGSLSLPNRTAAEVVLGEKKLLARIRETGCEVHVDAAHATMEFAGRPEAIKTATRLTLEGLGGCLAVEALPLPNRDCVGLFLADDGKVLKGIHKKSRCNLRLDRAGLTVQFMGPQLAIQNAKDMVAHLLQQCTASVPLPREGAVLYLGDPPVVSRIRTETGCALTIDRPNGLLWLTGGPKAVKAARPRVEQILALPHKKRDALLKSVEKILRGS